MENPTSFTHKTVSNSWSGPPSTARSEPEPETTVRYRECQRNHAAHAGHRVLDGCGDFMPTGDVGTPESMKCAACNCHRSFHRKEVRGGGGVGGGNVFRQERVFYNAPPGRAVMVAFGGGGRSESESDDGAGSKKRTRTRFTEEQKRRMMAFAERIGGRIPRDGGGAGGEVDEFCEEVGVTRRVFRVWLHNNKNAIKGKFESSQSQAQAQEVFVH